MSKSIWLICLLLSVVLSGLTTVLGPKTRLHKFQQLGDIRRYGELLMGRTEANPNRTLWEEAGLWETPLIPWKDTTALHDPKVRDRPLLLNLTTALLRTVLHDRCIFWGRNPDGRIRVHLFHFYGDSDAHPNPLLNATLYSKSRLSNYEMLDVLPSNRTDYTGLIQFNLSASTYHRFVIQLEIGGIFHNHLNGSFQTFPTPGEVVVDSFIFGFGSCLNPVDAKTSGQSVALLETWGLKFFFFIGDFIYFWDELPHESQEYNRYYYRKLLTKEIISAMRSTPWMFQFDDHEIHNDWVSEGLPQDHKYYKEAFFSYGNMLGGANPPINSPVAIPASERDYVKWYMTSYGNFHYFVMDTRSYKVNTPDLTGPLLGTTQKLALAAWVKEKCQRKDLSWCFVVSPTIFTHGSYRKDLWFGNMKEQAEVKAILEGEKGVTAPVSILSGDSHMSAVWEVAEFIHEFTCSPVDAFGLFYPWFRPPRFEKPPKDPRKRKKWKKSSQGWPVLGDLDPPKAFFEAVPRHLGPAGFNCLIESNTTVEGDSATVFVRFDIIDGHQPGGKLLHSHFQNYTHTYKRAVKKVANSSMSV